jgi:hypothetical protein
VGHGKTLFWNKVKTEKMVRLIFIRDGDLLKSCFFQEPLHLEDHEVVVLVEKDKQYKEKLQEKDQILFQTTKMMMILTARLIPALLTLTPTNQDIVYVTR